jgi:uncharacterized membrane-anchored protein YitT (DUF2179 family)
MSVTKHHSDNCPQCANKYCHDLPVIYAALVAGFFLGFFIGLFIRSYK